MVGAATCPRFHSQTGSRVGSIAPHPNPGLLREGKHPWQPKALGSLLVYSLGLRLLIC